MVTMGKLPQTPRAKKVIEYSMEEARNLNRSCVGTEHILLGLLRVPEGIAAQALMRLGATLEKTRKEVREITAARKADSRTPVHGWIQTYSGKQFFPLKPDPELISIKEIAVVLAREPRFGGHSVERYSVAQHCVVVSDCVSLALARSELSVSRPVKQALHLAGLLHDAHEAYCRDLPRPIAEALGGGFKERWSAIKTQLDRAIERRFGLLPGLLAHLMVKLADQIALATEKRDVMGPEPWPWHPLPDPTPSAICVLSEREARELFLQRFHELSGRE